jgi:hypothetical protein
MPAAAPDPALSPAYREAQRMLSAWLERGQREARRRALAARAALARLDAVERHRLARWLAWWCAATRTREAALQSRLRRLDTALGKAVAAARAQLPLPAMPAPAPRALAFPASARLGA